MKAVIFRLDIASHLQIYSAMNHTIGQLYLSILVTILLHIQNSHELRILGMFPFPGKSQFNMCESLMKALAERGHQVDVYSHFPLKTPVPNYTDFSLAGTLPIHANNIGYETFVSGMRGVSMSNLLNFGGPPTCEILNLPIFQNLVKNPPKDPPYDLVITELFLSDCHLAWGRHLRTSMVGLVTTVTMFEWMNDPYGNSFNPAVNTGVFSRFVAPMTFYERLENVFLYHYVKWTYNYYVREEDAYVEKIFGPGYPNVIEMFKDVDLVLLNHHYALNEITAYTPAIVPVAGLHIVDTGEKLPQNVEKFLDESKHGFVYVTFGSMIRIETFPKSVVDAFYGAFENIAPVRVLMKIAKPDELPPGLPSNVITHSWLPQITVLKHKNIKAFVTHGGLMGTQEAIYYGVPLIGIPLLGDQYLNVDSYVRKNIAVKLDWEHMTQQSLTDAINEVIKNPIYKESAEKVKKTFRDVPMTPKELSVFWVEYIARHGKNALRSPLVDMPWWQASLLDVYGFVILVVVSILFMTKKIITALFRVFLSSKKCANEKVKKN